MFRPGRHGQFKVIGLALAAALAAVGGTMGAEPPPMSFEAVSGRSTTGPPSPLLRTHCLECHSADLPEGASRS